MLNGNTLLHELCLECRPSPYKFSQFEQLMKTLLERGADPNLRNQGGTLFIVPSVQSQAKQASNGKGTPSYVVSAWSRSSPYR